MGGILLASFGALSGCMAAPSKDGLEIFAASSLADVFRDLESHFERTHPTVDVSISYAGSQTLRLQIEHGAHTDLFAAASPAHVLPLLGTGQVHDQEVFAKTDLVLIVPTANPAGITRFEDIANVGQLILADPVAPIGRYTEQVLHAAARHLGPTFVANVQRRVISLERNVRLVRAKIEMGEADAAIVYRTDARDRPDLRSISIPAAWNVEAQYPIVTGRDSTRSPQIQQWRAMLRSEAGKRILKEHGFIVEG